MTHHGISTDVALATDVLLQGGMIGLPTETVYGLATLALNETAVHRIFDTKGRPRNHPLIIHLAPSIDYRDWGIFDDDALSLAQAFWPGPLTLLVPRTSLVPDWVTGGRDTVALRVPSHPVAQSLLHMVNTGVVAPSANRFGKVSPTTAQHVLTDLGDEVDLILDGGSCEVGVESTIVECTDVFQILRPGKVTADDISTYLQGTIEKMSGSSRAPGMLEAHYAPRAKVLIVNTVSEAEDFCRGVGQGRKISILSYPDVIQFAQRMYDDFRQADIEQCDIIVAVRAPNNGIGIAINDRLHKAAATN